MCQEIYLPVTTVDNVDAYLLLYSIMVDGMTRYTDDLEQYD